MTTFGAWFHRAKEKLTSSSAFEDDANLTLRFLLEARLEKPFAVLQLSPETDLLNIEQLNQDVEKLFTGTPLPYLLGEWSFYGMDFTLTPDVLIPRPETELLVEQALQWLTSYQSSRIPFILDIGTGSGIIAITLAKHIIEAQIIAADISPQALEVCRQNIKRHNVSGIVSTCLADGIPPIQQKVDLLCANLPYIPEKTLQNLPVIKHEPRLALDGGSDGLRIIEKVLANSVHLMQPTSLLLFEIEASQGESAVNLAKSYYPHSKIIMLQDLAGKDRLLRIENP